MKTGVKILIVIVGILVVPVLVGFFQPKERLVTEMDVIEKMYFFIMADITNHWEEPAWRTNLDTMIQKEVVDGQDAWMEYYSNGDSVLLITQKIADTDYIRIIHRNDGIQLMRVITLADYQGKTAIRMSEEVYEKNPVKRFINLLNDPTKNRIRKYLDDLKEKNKPDPNAPQVESF